MKPVGIWIIGLSIAFAVLPLLLSYPAVWVGELANCAGLPENITCELLGVNVSWPVSFFSSFGFLFLVTAPLGILGIISGVIILIVAKD
ncbi:MAG: hypothetical protein DHS20C06_14300 [Hyphobacterium sp.]|nr:MAG: hypothetical protein DHS20C06_14300 [Hyphobacterium sp.]